MAGTRYHWKETAPGRYERDAGMYESLSEIWGNSTAQHGRIDGLVSAVIDFETEREDFVDAFRSAWLVMRQKRPALAASWEDGKLVYLSSDVDSWLKETFIVINERTAPEVLCALRKASRPTLRLFPKSKQVSISGEHSRNDQLGNLITLDALLELVAKPESQQVPSGDVISRLSVPYEVLGNVAQNSSPEDLQAETERLQQAFPPGVGLPAQNLDQPPSDMGYQTLTFSEAETTAIIKACKALGHTVAPVTHAAIIEAAEQIAGQTGDYTDVAIANMRPRFGAVGHDYSITLAYAQFMRIKSGTFLERVKELQQEYLAVRADNLNLPRSRAAFQVMVPAFAEPPPVPLTPARQSSFGVIDKYIKQSYGDIRVVRYLPLMLVMQPAITHFVYTLNGRLNIVGNYNTTYYRPQLMRELLAIIKEKLFKNLAIKSDV